MPRPCSACRSSSRCPLSSPPCARAACRRPRSVSLGLGLPFARPARSAMTMAAVVLGVTSVTLAAGLAKSVLSYQNAEHRTGAVQVTLFADRAPAGSPHMVPDGISPAGGVVPKLSDPADESLLRSLPGAAHVTASTDVIVRQVGTSQDTRITFYRGDSASLGYRVLEGHWLDGPGQVV